MLQIIKINPKKSIAGLLIVLLLASLSINFMLPKKVAHAQWASLPQQIIEYIMEIVNWRRTMPARKTKKKTWIISPISRIGSRTIRSTGDQKENPGTKPEKTCLMTWSMMFWKAFRIWETEKRLLFLITMNTLTRKLKEAFQEFVDDELSKVQMCDIFDQEVREAISAGNEPTFTVQETCPIGDPAALLAGTSQNFWADWLQMLRPQGNPIGAYMIAADEKLEAEALAYTGRIFQLTANQGFRGTEDTPGLSSHIRPSALQ